MSSLSSCQSVHVKDLIKKQEKLKKKRKIKFKISTFSFRIHPPWPSCSCRCPGKSCWSFLLHRRTEALWRLVGWRTTVKGQTWYKSTDLYRNGHSGASGAVWGSSYSENKTKLGSVDKMQWWSSRRWEGWREKDGNCWRRDKRHLIRVAVKNGTDRILLGGLLFLLLLFFVSRCLKSSLRTR